MYKIDQLLLMSIGPGNLIGEEDAADFEKTE